MPARVACIETKLNFFLAIKNVDEMATKYIETLNFNTRLEILEEKWNKNLQYILMITLYTKTGMENSSKLK